MRPLHRAFLGDACRIQHLGLLGVSSFAELHLEVLHVLEVVILDLLLFDANLHFSQLDLHAIQPIS